MTSQKINKALWPVMFGFFIMGFVDMIGIATNYVKSDFHLTDSTVNLISLSCYLWFLILSIPTGMLMGRIGHKRTVLLSFVVNVVGMCLPFVDYSYSGIFITFSLIGIGNTLLQVSLNPLVADVVEARRLTGVLTLGQFVKAVCSFVAPILAGLFALSQGGWKMLFAFFALCSLLGFVWLSLVRVQPHSAATSTVTFSSTFALFRKPVVVALFLGIVVLVGVDVSINMTFPKLLAERLGYGVEEAGLGNSVYFFARTAGALVGGILLLRYSEKRFFTLSSLLAFIGLAIMVVAGGAVPVFAGVVLFGLGYANLFSIIFGITLKLLPNRQNEASALLIVGLVGGAILPPVLGFVSDRFATQTASLVLIAIVWCYMLWLSRTVNRLATDSK